jgi:lysophosphatidate acyltransferase
MTGQSSTNYLTIQNIVSNFSIELGGSKKLALLAVLITFQSVFKNRGSFLYRQIVAYILIAIATSYGVLSSPIFFLLGKRGQINYSVAQVAGFLVKHFLGVTATIEGAEYLDRKENQLAVYVCNHQTLLDILFLGFFFPSKTSMVAKKVIKYYPFLGWFSNVYNCKKRKKKYSLL